jgi:extradiol dioxygenase family protein
MIQLIDHINIATGKLTETRDFYVEALGLKEGPRPEVGIQGCWLYAGDRAIVHLQLDRHCIDYRRIQQPGAPVRQLFLLDPNGVILELNSPCAGAG